MERPTEGETDRVRELQKRGARFSFGAPNRIVNILEAHHSPPLLMASSSNMNRNYHVFLSFRGTDVRKNFLSHLYTALDEKGIHTFVDSEKLRKGEQISPALMRAIEESRVAIIIFSKDYASSQWCLEEVVKIMECRKQKDLIVFPVFYKVEPREVRSGRKSYKKAMAKHKIKFGKDSERVRRWEEALSNAGSLSGWILNDSDEAELIGRIVTELSIYLDHTPLDVAKYPVGIDSQVQELLSWSQAKPGADDVFMIGIWGPGGIGKTTIAKALYNASIKRDDAIEKQFQGSSFLARVRETSNQSNGLVALQEQLLSQILFHKTVKVYNVDQGISLIRERLHCKKVLLVLDDVDQMDQLNALAGKADWFGKGSIIIFTSRDKHLLNSHGINCVYEVQSLGYKQARHLFGQHAFSNDKRIEIRSDLIDRVLHYANGLPLALEVLGSFLCGRNEPAWESALDKLSKSPDHTINQVLKSSFDGLEDNEQEIFLDIACFFRGEPIKKIKKVLDICGFNTTIGIEILIERSLIKEEFGTLQMHDLVELMGKHVVNQECHSDPWKRSRIWLFDDAMEILCQNTETNAVKAIVLNMPVPEEMTISPDAFINMKMLRSLIISNVHISSQGHVRLPDGLKYIDWSNSPNLEFGSGPKKVVSLNLHNSRIKQLGDKFHKFQDFRKLKFINFSGCNFLERVPDLSSAPNIERLDLSCCKRLEEVHQSVAFLGKLEYLTIKFCSNLREFPSTLQTKSLKWLNLCGFKFEKCPDIQVLENLEDLYLSGSAINELPASIGHLVSLRALHLKNCKNLVTLPSSIYKLEKLEHLDLQNCSNLVAFPRKLKDSIGLGFQNLEVLLLDGCNLSDVKFLERTSSFPLLKYLHLPSNEFTHPINKYDSWKGLFVYGRNQSLKRILSRAFLSGREMPEWILPGIGASISFMVPWDLYYNFLGLAICFVPILEGGDKYQKQFNFQVSVNGERLFEHIANLYKWESDGVWLGYVPRIFLHGVKELMPNEWSHFQVSIISPYKVRVKKCGFRLVCKQHEDDLRVRTLTPSADAREIGNLKERDSGKRLLSIDSEEDWTKKMRLWSSRPHWR